MRVEIYQPAEDGGNRVAGELRLVDGAIVPTPADSAILRGILQRPAYDARGNAYLPNLDAVNFLRLLHQQYTSPYLRASRVIEDDPPAPPRRPSGDDYLTTPEG